MWRLPPRGRCAIIDGITALLHRGPGSTRDLCTRYAFMLENVTFFGWACLDSNQGSLPYDKSKGISVAFCPVGEPGLFAVFSVLLPPPKRWKRRLEPCREPDTAQVAARLQ